MNKLSYTKNKTSRGAFARRNLCRCDSESIEPRSTRTRRDTLDKRGQVAIFVIVAIVIVTGIVIYYFAFSKPATEEFPSELSPVFNYYSDCIKTETWAAIRTTEAQGGWIDIGNYVPGSEYAPFSTHLNFLGTPVRYWYYVAGNGLIKEQVPTQTDMENGISDFVKNNLAACDFRQFLNTGYNLQIGEPEVKTEIQDGKVVVDVTATLSATKNGASATRATHHVEVDSKLGKFYNTAKTIYDKEKTDAFLEKYAIDVLYLYAPVNGVEMQCGPKIWSTQNVISGVKSALENNLAEIKFEGDYYKLAGKDSEYFVVKQPVTDAVNVMYSRNWPMKMEVQGDGVDEEVMIASPIGTQEGMGMMGFCYVPYHFVYDVSFPTMIQVYDENELFQFPVVVVIDKNVARQAELPTDTTVEAESYDLCAYKNKDVEINTFDVNLNKVNANVSYECFDQRCRLGESKNGLLRSSAPTCVNGQLMVSAGGYADKKQLFSTNKESFADVILDREYETEVSLEISGKPYNGTAIIIFTNDDGKTRAATLPGENKVKLSEGNYEVKAYVFGNSSVTIPASSKMQCVDQPKAGILGMFGATEEKCFTITSPETKMDYALIAGGQTNSYILETQLKGKKLKILTDAMPKPTSIEQLQKNFETFETGRIDLVFNVK
jgi:hypothetical protein